MGGWGLRQGSRSSWDAQWGLESEKHSRGCVGQGYRDAQAGVEGRGRHRSGVSSFLPRSDLTSCSSGCAVTEGMGTPNPSPTLSLASFLDLLGAGEGVNAAPQVLLSHLRPLSIPPAGWISGSPSSSPEQTGRVELGWGWRCGRQASLRPAVSPPLAGVRATRGLPSPRPGNEEREHRDWVPVAEGSVPGAGPGPTLPQPPRS